MRRIFVMLVVSIVVGIGGGTASAQTGVAVVTSGADSGPGTLRAALATGAGQVVIAPSVGTVALSSPLTWSGTSLVLVGTGQVVDGDGIVGTLLEVAGVHLRISGLDFRDTAGSGIRLAIPPTATGTATVDLVDVTVANTGLHGIHVDDLSGSSASVLLRTVNVNVVGAGTGESDQDGVRVDERGEGGITFVSSGSTFEANGADGVELDEGGSGDIVLDVVDSDFLENGPLDPEDLDDGIDVDEADAGSVRARIVQSRFVHNYDEAIDLNELGPGDVSVVLAYVTVTDTVEGDGLQVDEAGAGNVDVIVFGSTLVDNDGDDIDLEQAGSGTGTFRLQGSTVGSIKLTGVTQA